jgi:hypothetical protein
MAIGRVCFLGWAFLFFVHAGGFSQPAIEVSGVPEPLLLPLPEGTSQILTARISGGQAVAVWLAPNEDAQVVLRLTPTGPNTYEANLGQPFVLAIVALAQGEEVVSDLPESGEFRVFAVTPEGKTISSGPLRFALSFYGESRRKPRGIQATISVFTVDGTEQLQAGGFRRHWFEPKKVVRIEVRIQWTLEKPFARAEVNGESWDFVPSLEENVLALSVTKEIRNLWSQHGSLTIEYGSEGSISERLVLKDPPERLELPGDSVAVNLHQRRTKYIPGGGLFLTMRIADITRGQTALSIQTERGDALLKPISVQQGDEVAFQFGDERFKVTVEKLVNFLIGSDYGVFRISRLGTGEVRQIASDQEAITRLIRTIEASDVTFIREGKEYDGAAAADHLRDKLEFARGRITTLDQFIDRIASRSSVTGEEYLVKRPDGKTVKARDWLRERADALK